MNSPAPLALSACFEDHLPLPETVDRGCLICSSTDNVMSVSKISCPPRIIILQTEEPRCSKHYEFLKCSFCREYFDPKEVQNQIKKPTRFPAILCSSHQDLRRCKNCGKWADLGHSECQACRKLVRPIKGKYYTGLQPSLSENLRRWTLDKMACRVSVTTSNISRSPSLDHLPTTNIKPMSFTNVWTPGAHELTTGNT